MTKTQKIRKVEKLIKTQEENIADCKNNDSKLEHYYNGKLEAYKIALTIIWS